jgi:hypothetical protein
VSSPTGARDGCQLCAAERLTVWHFEDDQCWVTDCIVCGTPMIVWRSHGLPDADGERALLERLQTIAAQRYPAGFWIDGERRKIPDHWHAHARPADRFFDHRVPEPWRDDLAR